MRNSVAFSTRTGRRHRCTGSSVAACIGLCLGLLPAAAYAVQCSIATPGLAFGNYDVFAAAPTNGAGTISVTCSVNPSGGKVSYTISLSAGSSNSFVQRQMQGSGYTLNYNLYTSNTYSVVWGDGSGSTSNVTGSMRLNKNTNPTQTNQHTVYGRIPALQDAGVSPNYLDTIIVTLNY